MGQLLKSMESLSLDQRKAGQGLYRRYKNAQKRCPMFTDKMPNNFRYIGLIHLIMPNAKIIDARRYPLDCCFSMFKQLFAKDKSSPWLAEAEVIIGTTLI